MCTLSGTIPYTKMCHVPLCRDTVNSDERKRGQFVSRRSSGHGRSTNQGSTDKGGPLEID